MATGGNNNNFARNLELRPLLHQPKPSAKISVEEPRKMPKIVQPRRIKTVNKDAVGPARTSISAQSRSFVAPESLARGSGINYYAAAKENPVCLFEKVKCTRDRATGQPYCIQHMKLEQNTSYRKCNYISSKTGQKCPNVLLRTESGKEGFCLTHARLVTYVRRQAARRNRHRDTPDTLVHSLKHYQQFAFDQNKTPKSEIIKQTHAKAPKTAIDYFSDSSDEEEMEDSITEAPFLSDLVDGDYEDMTDPLKHAGTYTAEEIVVIARDKLIKLQTLYNEYFNILAQKYRLKKQYYKQKIKEETQLFGPIDESWGTSYKEKKKLRQLKALQRYQKRHGLHKLLKDELKKRRIQAASSTQIVENAELSKCQIENCMESSLPASKFCQMHIMEDKSQVLFVLCHTDGCPRPVIASGEEQTERCWLHKRLQKAELKTKPTQEQNPELRIKELISSVKTSSLHGYAAKL